MQYMKEKSDPSSHKLLGEPIMPEQTVIMMDSPAAAAVATLNFIKICNWGKTLTNVGFF